MTRPLVRLNPPELWDATQNHHSQGTLVEGGRLAFFSGQIAARKGVDRAPSSLREQTEVVCGKQACDFPAYVERKLVPIVGTQAHEVVVELRHPLK